MAIVLPFAFLICAYASYLINKKRLTHTVVFPLLWGVIMLFECMHLLGLNKSDDLTYAVIAVGVFSFLIGSMLFSRVVLKRNNLKVSYRYCINQNLLQALLVVTILLLLYPAITNIMALRSGTTNFSTIRSSFGNIYKNIVLKLAYNYIALPFSSACLAISSVILFEDYDKKVKIRIFFMVAVVIAERVYVDAGRGIMLYFLVMLFFSYMLGGREKIHNKNGKKIIIWVSVAVITAFLAVTLARGGAIGSLLKQVYIYICGCVPFLNANIQEVNQSGNFLYGTGGLHGAFQFLFTMLENIGLCKYPQFMTLSDYMYNSALQRRVIGDSLSFNAYATAFYNVYLDGGIVAVGFEMFLYGALLSAVYNKFKVEKNNVLAKAVYVYLLYGIVFSFVRFQFALANHLIAYVFMFLIIQKRELTDEGSTD